MNEEEDIIKGSEARFEKIKTEIEQVLHTNKVKEFERLILFQIFKKEAEKKVKQKLKQVIK